MLTWASSIGPRFPQQPTLTDQSYDESQFESYRRLGLHSIEEISNFETDAMAPAEEIGRRENLDPVFDDLAGHDWESRGPRQLVPRLPR